MAGSSVRCSHCIHSQEAEGRQEMEPRYKTLRPASSDPLPPAGICSLKVPQPFKVAPPAEDHMFKHMSRGEWGGMWGFKPQHKPKVNESGVGEIKGGKWILCRPIMLVSNILFLKYKKEIGGWRGEPAVKALAM